MNSDTLLRREARRHHSDSGLPEFLVVIDDPERGVYEVQVKRYIDADRAGFCGYINEVVYEDLDQVEASEIARKLNQFKQEEHDAYLKKMGLK